MKNKILLTVIPLLAVTTLALVGCASYTIQPIAATELKAWNAKQLAQGYVFYQPELYFLVTATPPKPTSGTGPANPPAADANKGSAAASTEGTGTVSVTPIYLPNPHKPYRVTTFNFLAKSNFTFNFKDGWQLTSIADQADNSGVTTALVGQLKPLLDAAAKLTAGPGTPVPKTFLIHPEYDHAGVITGFTPIVMP